jgi:hypothetical protein
MHMRRAGREANEGNLSGFLSRATIGRGSISAFEMTERIGAACPAWPELRIVYLLKA